MRIGYLECFAGVSGDMLMGALVDSGVSAELLRQAAASLALGVELHISKVNRSGIQATKVDVMVEGRLAEHAAVSGAHEHQSEASQSHSHSDHSPEHSHGHHADHAHHHKHSHGRTLPAIRDILVRAPISERARGLSMAAFELLADAEARIHGIPAEKVHFHEVGAVDAIADIVMNAVAVEALSLDRWYCSPVNVGGGFVDCAHGRFPVPAPATAELLKDVPVYSANMRMELATPTGAALLRALDCSFDATPVMRVHAIGYGAGTRNPEGFPNVLRVSVGETAESRTANEEKITVLECAIDDLSPQLLAHTAQLALERGALDVMSAPVTMKKGRLGTLMTILCKAADAGPLQELFFRETSTLGMRVREENRVCLVREMVPVETEFGVIRVKAGSWHGEVLNAAPEFEDCRTAAEAFHVPLKTVMQAALAAWRREAESPSRTGAAS